MALHVCHGATLKCSLGTTPSTMAVLPLHRMLTNGQPAANIGDHVPLLNIMPFGVCQLTRLPCVSAIPAPWIIGAPNAILNNLTTDEHWVYPGTIRRVVIERKGHLFVFTSGAGENAFRNSGTDEFDSVLSLTPPNYCIARIAAQMGRATGNDVFGARAFRTLDSVAFAYVQSRRTHG